MNCRKHACLGLGISIFLIFRLHLARHKDDNLFAVHFLNEHVVMLLLAHARLRTYQHPITTDLNNTYLSDVSAYLKFNLTNSAKTISCI